MRAGFFLRKHETSQFEVIADDKTLYSGSLCFYDYFLEEEASFILDYKMIAFRSYDEGMGLVIENFGDKYLCYEYTTR